jgi:nicotinamidase-related amidase
MDVWDIQKMIKAQRYNNKFDDVTKNKIVPLLNVVRKNGIFVIHAAHGKEEHPLIRQLPGEMNASNIDTKTLTKILRMKGIDTIIYSGFATNQCIFFVRLVC